MLPCVISYSVHVCFLGRVHPTTPHRPTHCLQWGQMLQPLRLFSGSTCHEFSDKTASFQLTLQWIKPEPRPWARALTTNSSCMLGLRLGSCPLRPQKSSWCSTPRVLRFSVPLWLVVMNHERWENSLLVFPLALPSLSTPLSLLACVNQTPRSGEGRVESVTPNWDLNWFRAAPQNTRVQRRLVHPHCDHGAPPIPQLLSSSLKAHSKALSVCPPVLHLLPFTSVRVSLGRGGRTAQSSLFNYAVH